MHIGELLIKPIDPVKLGYEFVGWYLDDNLFDFSTYLNEDTTLKAVWINLIEKQN